MLNPLTQGQHNAPFPQVESIQIRSIYPFTLPASSRLVVLLPAWQGTFQHHPEIANCTTREAKTCIWEIESFTNEGEVDIGIIISSNLQWQGTIRKHSGHAWVSTSDVSAWPWRDINGNSHQNLSHQAHRASLHARSANTSGVRRSRMRCAARRTWRLGSSLQRKTWRKSRRKRVLGIPQRHLEKLTVTFRFFHGGATFVTTCGLIISFSLLQMEDSPSFPLVYSVHTV